MRSTMCAAALFSFVALGFLGPSFSRGAELATVGTAAQLVRAALESELTGASDERAQLLAEALQRDPNYAPARWHSGFVHIGDEWIKIDDVPGRVGKGPELAAYRKKRDALVDTADHHRELARWCRKNRLNDEARVHWAKLLEFDPQDAEALSALGLQLYEGRLLTRSQIEKAQVAAGERMRAIRKWQPQLVKWRRAIERGSDADREAALMSLKQFDDAAAIEALEAVFGVDGRGEKIIALNRALIETLGRMGVAAATEVLLRRAVLGEPEQVRDLAIAELKKRPMHAYVPLLIAALPGSVKTQFHVYVLPGGMVLHEHEVMLEGREANVSLNFESAMNPADAAAAMLATPQALERELRLAGNIEARAQAARQRLDALRDRLHIVLSRTTGFANVSEPELWQKQYDDYHGWYTPTSEKPTYTYSNTAYQSAASAPVDQVTRVYRRDPPHSCFPAGTKIWTGDGMRAIETIKPGDRILAQDAASGELAYKPVQATTLRPSVALSKIQLGSDFVVATPGHPFWVVGEGWRVARRLEPGCRLHGANGAVCVEAIDEYRSLEVYNLVVSEFHTYFVGEARLLVHDNSPLVELPQCVPGLAFVKTGAEAE